MSLPKYSYQENTGQFLRTLRAAVAAHLAAGHVGDRPVGLDGLQLVEAPVQLLQRLPRSLDIILVCKHSVIHWTDLTVSGKGNWSKLCVVGRPEGSLLARWLKAGPEARDGRRDLPGEVALLD